MTDDVLVTIKGGKVTLERDEPREPIPHRTEVLHPFWYEPPAAGKQLHLEGDVDGVPWTANIIAGPKGWSHVVGMAVGTFGVHDLIHAVENMTGHVNTVDPDEWPSLSEHVTRALAAAEAQLRDIEGTRRVITAIHADLYPNDVPSDLDLRVERTKTQEVEIAARIYNAVVANMTRPKPIPFIAAYLACSERTAGSRVALARERGLLGEAKVGYANTQDKKKTKKSGGKK